LWTIEVLLVHVVIVVHVVVGIKIVVWVEVVVVVVVRKVKQLTFDYLFFRLLLV
jgi:hypothetical protein